MNKLQELALKGSLDEIKDYVEKNKDIPKKQYNVAIVQAVVKVKPDIVQFLYEKGANINSKSNNGYTLMDIILNKLDKCKNVTYNLENIFDFLVKIGANTNKYNGEIFTDAVSHGLIKTVKYMLEAHGIDINSRFVFGDTALLISCNKNKKELSKFLIENGADVNLANNNGLTPLHMACSRYDIETVKLLLEKGADLHAKNEYGAQALVYALGWSPLVKFLIEKGADINNVDIHQRTPLFMTVNYHENYETIKLLLENGADPYIKSKGELGIDNLCHECKNLVLSYMNKPKLIELDLPSEIECFDEVEHSYISIKEFVKTNDQILIRIGDNLKGYNRRQLISHYEKNGNLYSREVISQSDFKKIYNREYLFFTLVNTGIENVLLAYSKEKFL